ncbi:MAG TPA: cytochrome c oxidase assembly protein [Beutenbergiaceae bacterium]|nr:cytochrome c oxidase assembly protein [Beutenbergiaceae bacterium]
MALPDPLFEFTLGSHVAHLLMVVHFSLAGYIFINILIGIDPGPRRPFYPLRLVLLLPSMVFHTFFGLGLVSSTALMATPYYARLQCAPDPLADQQIEGALAWGSGELPVLALAVIIALKWVRTELNREDRQRQRNQRETLRLGSPPGGAGG